MNAFRAARRWVKSKWYNVCTRLNGGAPAGETLKGKYYTRTGDCVGCGDCCRNIYLIHEDKTIDSLEMFEALKPKNPEYQHFTPDGLDDEGMRFSCQHLQADDSCAIYDSRPLLCRIYPSEKSLLLGGTLSENCTYEFTPIRPFQDILKATHRTEKPRIRKSKTPATVMVKPRPPAAAQQGVR